MLIEPGRFRPQAADLQDRLPAAMGRPETVSERAGIPVRAAKCLGVPTLVFEPGPKGRGPTDPRLESPLGEEAVPALRH